MRRALALVAVVAAALAAAGPAGATNECKGLQVCVPVAGPWVAVPTSLRVPRPQARFQLSCPKGMIVAGLDAELTDRQIDIGFLGGLGSPVNPGITTTGDALFSASFVGTRPQTPLFRPHIGCMPARGGGGRVPTAVPAILPPGHPTVRHVRNVELHAGTRQRIVQGCARGERLVDAWASVGFPSSPPPPVDVVSSVRIAERIAGGEIAVTARVGQEIAVWPARVQIGAVCAGGS